VNHSLIVELLTLGVLVTFCLLGSLILLQSICLGLGVSIQLSLLCLSFESCIQYFFVGDRFV
jgi:hypothetical protein